MFETQMRARGNHRIAVVRLGTGNKKKKSKNEVKHGGLRVFDNNERRAGDAKMMHRLDPGKNRPGTIKPRGP